MKASVYKISLHRPSMQKSGTGMVVAAFRSSVSEVQPEPVLIPSDCAASTTPGGEDEKTKTDGTSSTSIVPSKIQATYFNL